MFQVTLVFEEPIYYHLKLLKPHQPILFRITLVFERPM